MPRVAKHIALSVFIAGVATCSTLAYADSCKNPLYLTFDTGNMSAAEEIATTLKEKNVRATFFVANNPTPLGDRTLIKHWAAYWQARVNEGHVFGNHTWSHHFVRKDNDNGSLTAYSREGKAVNMNKAEFCAELTRVDAAFHELTGRHLTHMWRAPAGRTTQNSIRWAAECGYPVHVGWSAAGYIGDDTPSDKYPNTLLLERAVKSIQKGDIILMHLGVWSRKQPAAPILPELIDRLRARGFCFKTLGASQY